MNQEIKLFKMNSGKPSWKEWIPVSQCTQQQLKDANLREMWSNEIVLDDDKNREIEIEQLLEKDRYTYLKFKTGSKGTHYHLFFKELENKTDSERKMIRKAFIQKYGCDEAKQSGVIAYEFRPHFKTGKEKQLVKGNMEVCLKGENILPKFEEQISKKKVVLCPWHDDHHPSLGVDYKERICFCRSCHVSASLEAYEKWIKGEKEQIVSYDNKQGAKHYYVEGNIDLEEKKVWSLKELFEKGIPEIEWIAENIIPSRGISFFTGNSCSYKSWTAMQLALAISTGTQFLNKFETKKSTVLYIDEESGDITIPVRFEQLTKGHQLEVSENLFISIFNNITIDQSIGTSNIAELIEVYKPQIVIIDSVVRCMSGNENDSQDVRKVFNHLKEIFKKYDELAFILIHHTTKQNSGKLQSMRGSGDFGAMAENVIMFQNKGKQKYRMSIAKNRHLSGNPEYDVEVISDGDKGPVTLEASKPEETPQKTDRCVEDIKEWIENEQLNIFQTGKNSKITTYVYNLEYTQNTFYNALKQLEELKIIQKISRGKYKVLKSTTNNIL
jgi:hypothetical protein